MLLLVPRPLCRVDKVETQPADITTELRARTLEGRAPRLRYRRACADAEPPAAEQSRPREEAASGSRQRRLQPLRACDPYAANAPAVARTLDQRSLPDEP